MQSLIYKIILTVVFVVNLAAQGSNDWHTITYMNNITDVIPIEDNIWVATTGGVYIFDPLDSVSTAYTNIDGLGSVDLTSIEKDTYGTVITAARDGIINRYLKNTDSWEIYSNLIGEQITDLFVHDDTLWVATHSGAAVFLINTDNLEFRDYFTNLPVDPEISYRITVFNNHVYLATENGLLKAPSDFIRNNLKISAAWQVLTVNDNLPSNSVRDVVSTDDSLLIGTAEGAASMSLYHELKKINSWTNGLVSRIIISQTDIYIVKYNAYYKQIESQWIWMGYEEKPINTGFLNANNELWLGLRKGGLKKTSWSRAYLVDGPTSNSVGSLIKDRTGNLWIASGKFKLYNSDGFYMYDFDHWTNFKFIGNPWSRKNQMVTVYEDRFGKIWFGAWGGGVTILEGENVGYYHSWSGEGGLQISTNEESQEILMPSLDESKRSCLPPARVQASDYTVSSFFKEDMTGNLWIANYLARDPEYLTVLPRDSEGNLPEDCENWIYFGANIGMSTSESEISSLEFDNFGRLWIGTYSAGILVFDYNGTIDNINDDQPLFRINVSNANIASNTILYLAHDLDGTIWIGTSGGLNSYDGQNFYSHIGEVGPVENKINQIFVDNFNNKWFATDGGMSILEAAKSPWDPDAWIHYTNENSGLPGKIVNSIFVDSRRSEAYIGTESGLSIFSGPYTEYKTELNSVISGPSPFILNDQTNFTIKNIVYGAMVKILNLNGKLIRSLSSENGGIEGGRAIWDGRDSGGKKVASGIYMYLIYNDEGVTSSGKIAVINP